LVSECDTGGSADLLAVRRRRAATAYLPATNGPRNYSRISSRSASIDDLGPSIDSEFSSLLKVWIKIIARQIAKHSNATPPTTTSRVAAESADDAAGSMLKFPRNTLRAV
jgi:hypothetical protein